MGDCCLLHLGSMRASCGVVEATLRDFKLYINSKFESDQGKRDPTGEKITEDFFHSRGLRGTNA